MNAIDFALRAYPLHVPPDLLNRPRIERDIRFPRRELEAWMRDHVLPAIRGLWQRARFQDAATWPQRAFRPRGKTSEWQLVNEVAKALRQSARDVLAIAELAAKRVRFPTPETAESMLDLGFVQSGEVTIEDSNEPAPSVPRESHPRDPLTDVAMAVLQSEPIKGRRSSELVNIEDYFGPIRDAVTVMDGKPVTVAAFIPYFNLRLGHTGNQVVRSMITRINLDRDALKRIRGPAYLRLNQRRSGRTFEREQRSWQTLNELVDRVEYEFLTSDEARLREGSMVLIQVLLDFAEPLPDSAWLGLPDYVITRNRGLIRHQLDGGAGYKTAERIAQALSDVQQLYRGAPANEPEKEEAIAAGHLVIDEATHEAFWETKRIVVEWNQHRSSWQMFWLLAALARTGQAVGHDDLFAEPISSRSTMANRWRRLKLLLPPSFHRLVQPGPQPSTYRLNLDRHRIHLLVE